MPAGSFAVSCVRQQGKGDRRLSTCISRLRLCLHYLNIYILVYESARYDNNEPCMEWYRDAAELDQGTRDRSLGKGMRVVCIVT